MKYIVILLLMVFASSCALQTPPTGGPVDELPPKLIKADPPQKTTNFAFEKIELHFDEYILLEDVFSEVVISPPMEPSPKFTYRSKKVIINLKGISLKERTTYTIFFGNSIVDFRASNPADNFTYVFATGDYIDSFYAEGNVYLAKNKQPAKDILVMLYDNLNDSVITSEKPYYFSKTNSGGQFKIENIREGTYRLFALKDENRNYRFDLESELLGFLDSDIKIDSSTKDRKLSINVFQQEPTKQYLKSVRNPQPGLILITYSKPIRTFRLNTPIYSNKDFAKINKGRDTIFYWYSDVYADFMDAELIADSIVIDSTKLSLSVFEQDSLFSKQNRLTIAEDPGSRSKLGKKAKRNISIYKNLVINLSRPVTSIEVAQIKVVEDSSRVELPVDVKIHDGDNSKIIVSGKWKEDSDYEFLAGVAAFTDYLGTVNSKISLKFSTDKLEDYGTLNLLFSEPLGEKFLIELSNSRGAVIKRFTVKDVKSGKIGIGKIKGGVYSLRIVQDMNGNGQWDAGKLSVRRQPEKVIYYLQNLNIKSNWETDFEIKIDQQ